MKKLSIVICILSVLLTNSYAEEDNNETYKCICPKCENKKPEIKHIKNLIIKKTKNKSVLIEDAT